MSDDELIGQTIAGRYRIISKLGAGGMGTAYRAWDEHVGIPVVVKIPKRRVFEDPQFAERFRREIGFLQILRYAYIVPFVDDGNHDGLPFVVLRFLPGGTLEHRMLRDEQRKPVPNPVESLWSWLPAIAGALDYVHTQGVAHRDVKPANIFFDAFSTAFLGDFGVAKVVGESDAFDEQQTLTGTNMAIGTVPYMGPERFRAKSVADGQADQYALAVVVYEMLAATRPFTGAMAHLIVEVTTHSAPPLSSHRRDLPASLVDAVHRGLAKNPAERFGSCTDFARHVLQHVGPLEQEPGVARLLCPHCSSILKLSTEAAGKKGRCPRCLTSMKVAADLGALWLLDEARRQKQSAEGLATVIANNETDATASEPEREEAPEELTTFKPLKDRSALIRARRKRQQSNDNEVWVVAGILALFSLLLFLLFF